jgi:hypothetical protein
VALDPLDHLVVERLGGRDHGHGPAGCGRERGGGARLAAGGAAEEQRHRHQ